MEEPGFCDLIEQMRRNRAKTRTFSPSPQGIEHDEIEFRRQIECVPGDTAERVWSEIELAFGL